MTTPAKPKKKRKQKKYATAKHPTIEAALEGLYKFTNKDDAIERLRTIKGTFIGKKKISGEKEDPLSFVLWIRGYGITPEDKTNGYRGHYARIQVAKDASSMWTLQPVKQDVPLHQHPQRQRPKFDHPDWNHPVLRSVRAGRTYDTYEEVLGELETLHVEFPNVTIPGKDRLHLIIYEGKESDSYVKKYILHIRPSEGEKYRIESEAKSQAPTQTKRKLRQMKAEDQPESLGSFTARVRSEKLRKRK